MAYTHAPILKVDAVGVHAGPGFALKEGDIVASLTQNIRATQPRYAGSHDPNALLCQGCRIAWTRRCGSSLPPHGHGTAVAHQQIVESTIPVSMSLAYFTFVL